MKTVLNHIFLACVPSLCVHLLFVYSLSLCTSSLCVHLLFVYSLSLCTSSLCVHPLFVYSLSLCTSSLFACFLLVCFQCWSVGWYGNLTDRHHCFIFGIIQKTECGPILPHLCKQSYDLHEIPLMQRRSFVEQKYFAGRMPLLTTVL